MKITSIQTFPEIGIELTHLDKKKILILSKEQLFRILFASLELGILDELLKELEFTLMIKELANER